MTTISKLARRRDLYVLPPRGAGIPAPMWADTFRQLEDEFKAFPLPEQIRLALGLGRKVMVQIEDAGLIQRLSPEVLVLESKPFRRSGIEALVKGCMRLAPKLTKLAVQRRRQLLLQQLLDETANAVPYARLDRVEPGIPREQLRAARIRRCATLLHGVVSAGVPTPVMARCNKSETTPPPDANTYATPPDPIRTSLYRFIWSPLATRCHQRRAMFSWGPGMARRTVQA